MFFEMRFALGTLDSGVRSLPFGLLVVLLGRKLPKTRFVVSWIISNALIDPHDINFQSCDCFIHELQYCMKGKCSTTEDADKLPDTCPYGNRPSANCSGVNLMPSVCYLPIIFYDCCNSCLNVSLPKKGI